MATFVALEMLLAVLANSFILVFTLCDPKSLRKSSTILLMSLTLSNLVMSVAVMPFTVITAGVGEWIFGTSDEEKFWVCKLVALVFSFSVSSSVHSLPAISFDRFLFIVKPVKHREIMKPWVAASIVLGIVVAAILFNIVPFVGLGAYDFSPSIASCVPIWSGNTGYVIYITVESLIPLTIILVTTIWTFLFTRNFVKGRYEDQRAASVENICSAQTIKHDYDRRLCSLFGIFGMLLLVNAVSFLPFMSLSIVGFFVGFTSLPAPLYATVFILFLLNNVTNPLVQSYFRRDLWDCVLRFGMRISNCLGLHSGKTYSNFTTKFNTCTTDVPTRTEIREDRSYFNAMLDVHVHGGEAIELNKIQFPEKVETENTVARDCTGVVETEFNLTTKNDAAIPSPCAYAANEDVNKCKLQHECRCVVEIEFDPALRSYTKMPSPCEYASSEDVNEWKMQQRRDTI